MTSAQQLIKEHSIWMPFCGCWLWMGRIDKRGYGDGHRLSYLAFRGPIPEGMCVCHTCDTPSCVNPDHLFLGTRTDNSKDRDRKGRQAKGERHGMYGRTGKNGPMHGRTGESCPTSKLKEEQIRKIFYLYRKGYDSKSIASNFKVSRRQISYILQGRYWKYLGNV